MTGRQGMQPREGLWGVLGEMDVPTDPTVSVRELMDQLQAVCSAVPSMTVEWALAFDDGTPVSLRLERLLQPLKLENQGKYVDTFPSAMEIEEQLAFDFSPRQAAWQLRRWLSQGLAYSVAGDRAAAHALAPEVIALLGPHAVWRANGEAYERQPDTGSSWMPNSGPNGLTDTLFSVGLVGTGNGYHFVLLIQDDD